MRFVIAWPEILSRWQNESCQDWILLETQKLNLIDEENEVLGGSEESIKTPSHLQRNVVDILITGQG